VKSSSVRGKKKLVLEEERQDWSTVTRERGEDVDNGCRDLQIPVSPHFRPFPACHLAHACQLVGR
jgi:hypothetical protein